MNRFVDINEVIDLEGKEYFAHLKDKDRETLKEHTSLTNEFFLKIVESKKLQRIFDNFFDKTKFPETYRYLFMEIIFNVSNFHDFGKINPDFQARKMGNNLRIRPLKGVNKSDHSMLSAAIYIYYFIDKVNELVEDEVEQFKFYEIIFSLGYVISRHHSNLDEYKKFITERKYIRIIEGLFDNDEVIEVLEEFDFEDFSKEFLMSTLILTKLMHSLVIAADYYATTNYMNDFKETEFGDFDCIDKLVNAYEESELIQHIRNNKPDNGINKLRTELFLEAEDELSKNNKGNIFFLEAPTGSGKSNTAMNLSFKLLDKEYRRKIFYVYPFNTLVEQNMDTINKIFGDSEDIMENVAVVNSITPLREKKVDNENFETYSETLLDRQFYNYPFVITTHVTLFDTLTGNAKASNMPFYQLAGSVIVLDEIQAYKESIWSELIELLNLCSELMDIKIIIMSATLPDLGILLKDNSKVIHLLPKESRNKYFEDPLFKNRVDINFDLLDKEELDFEDLINHIDERKEKKIFIEFITKANAKEFYKKAKEEIFDREVYLLTGEDNRARKKEVIEKVSTSEENVLFVATQVVEAGVDIDMDVGYKDISSVINEEQFLGRINRSCKKDGQAFFFDMSSASKVYVNNIGVQNNMSINSKKDKDLYRKILKDKNFGDFYSRILKYLSEEENANFNKYVEEKNFVKLAEYMKLISDDNNRKKSYFFNNSIEIDGEILIGSEVWIEYKEVLKEKDYAKQKVMLYRCRAKMSYFIYEIYEDIPYNDRIGDLLYIEDSEEYFDENGVLLVEDEDLIFI